MCISAAKQGIYTAKQGRRPLARIRPQRAHTREVSIGEVTHMGSNYGRAGHRGWPAAGQRAGGQGLCNTLQQPDSTDPNQAETGNRQQTDALLLQANRPETDALLLHIQNVG